MGELIVMPLRNAGKAEEALERTAPASAELPNDAPAGDIDFTVWTKAPRERTVSYFPTYSAVSRAMQTALRGWTREWFAGHAEVLLKPHTAYPILVYQCTNPFAGRPTNTFTYDIQETQALNRAFGSAASRMGRELKKLNTKRFPWLTREHYFAYRGKEVVKYVIKNPRAIYRMLHVETVLMDAILKFSIMDLPLLGMEESLMKLRRTFRTQLHRFNDQFDLSPRAEDLLRIATDALVAKMAENAALALPMPLAA